MSRNPLRALALSWVVVGKEPASNYARLFWIFAIVYAALWTALPSLFYSTYPLDVIEGLVWGQHWELGYYKHPPLQAWLLRIAWWAGGQSPVAIYALSQLAVVATFGFVRAFAREILGSERQAFWSVMLLACVYSFSYATPEFNPNVLQAPFWAMLAWALQRALSSGLTRFWIVGGVAAAAGLLTKYFMAVEIGAVALFMLFHPDGRRALGSRGPWLGMLTALVLLTPHLVWLQQSGWLPLHYAARRSGLASGALAWLRDPLNFLAGQVLAVAGIPLTLLLARAWRARPFARVSLAARHDAVLLALGLGPLLMCMMVAAVTPLRTAWGAPMGCFAGVLAVRAMPRAFDAARALRLVPAWTTIAALFPIAFVAINVVYPYIHQRPIRTLFPARELASAITAEWRAQTGRPLPVVFGTVWLAGNVAMASSDQPTVWIEPIASEDVSIFETSPWISLDRVACTGLVIVWRAEVEGSQELPARYRQFFAAAIVQPTLKLAAGPRPVDFDWAIVRPVRGNDDPGCAPWRRVP